MRLSYQRLKSQYLAGTQHIESDITEIRGYADIECCARQKLSKEALADNFRLRYPIGLLSGALPDGIIPF